MKATLLLAIPLLLAAIPTTQALDALSLVPVPSPSAWVPDGHTGYDWNARVNHTHEVIPALQPTNTIDLGQVHTAYVDVEVTGLRPGEAIQVANTITGHPYVAYAYQTASMVIWDVPAVAGTITLTDAHDGSFITEVVLGQNTFSMAGTTGGTMTRPCSPCGGTAPYITGIDYGQAWVTLNGAVATTSDVTITVTSAWKHTNSASAGANFGAGASNIGYSRAYTWDDTASASITSKGTGQRGLILVDTEADHYSDGSTAIYVTSPAYSYGSVGWGWSPPNCCRPYPIENAATNGPQGFTLGERFSGSVAWNAAWTYEGITANAATSSDTDNSATVQFSFHPTDNAHHDYTWDIITGDGSTSGQVGWAYKND